MGNWGCCFDLITSHSLVLISVVKEEFGSVTELGCHCLTGGGGRYSSHLALMIGLIMTYSNGSV